MAVTWPQWLGSAKSSVSGTTLAITYTNAPAVGKHVVIVARISANVNISTVTDNASGGSNTYQIDIQNQASGQQIALVSAKITNTITAASTVCTITLASAVTNKVAQIQRMDGADTTTWFGAAGASTGGFGTSRTGASVSPATIGDGILNAYYTDTTETSYAVGAGYTVLPQPSGLNYEPFTSPNGGLEGQWLSASATGAQTPPASTSGQSVFWAGLSAWYKQLAATTTAPRRTLMGVGI